MRKAKTSLSRPFHPLRFSLAQFTIQICLPLGAAASIALEYIFINTKYTKKWWGLRQTSVLDLGKQSAEDKFYNAGQNILPAPWKWRRKGPCQNRWKATFLSCVPITMCVNQRSCSRELPVIIPQTLSQSFLHGPLLSLEYQHPAGRREGVENTLRFAKFSELHWSQSWKWNS